VNLWGRLTGKQTKDVTSKELAQLGQLTYVDLKAKEALNQLEDLNNKLSFLTAKGAPILSDGIYVKTYTINNNSQDVKPSNIFDSSTDPYANKYLLRLLGVSCTFSDAGAQITGKIKDTVAIMRRAASSASGQEPMQIYDAGGIYFNEDYPLTFAEGGNVSTTLEVAVAIVSRGGV